MKTATLLKPEQVFRALSDKTRLRILSLLLEGELCVCDIVSVLRVPQPTASRHLAYLRKVGLVRGRKAGVWRYYRLARGTSEFEVSLVKCLEQCGETMPRLKKDLASLKQVRSTCCE